MGAHIQNGDKKHFFRRDRTFGGFEKPYKRIREYWFGMLWDWIFNQAKNRSRNNY